MKTKEEGPIEDANRGGGDVWWQMFCASFDAIILASSDGTILDVNAEACRLFALTTEEIRRVGRDGLMDPADDRVAPFLGELARSGKVRGELRMKRGDGSLFPAAVASAVFHDSSGNSLICVVIRDMTEPRRLEEELRQNEKRYRALYEKTPAMVHSSDRSGRLVAVSDFWLDSLGYRREEVIGRSPLEFMTEGARRHAEEVALPAFFCSGEARNVPLQMRKKSGEVLDLLLSATAERDAAGEITRSLCVLVDVTERLRAETALAQSEEFLRQLIENSPVAVCIMDRVENIEYLNRKFTAKFGYTREDIPDVASWWPRAYPDERYRDEIRERWNAAVARAMADGTEIGPMEARVTCKDGSVRFVEGYGAPVGTKFLVIFSDITRRKNAEEKVELLNTTLVSRAAEMEDANNELEAFSHTVSHDLRSPLTQITGYVQLLQELYGGQLDEQGRDFLREVATAARRMGRLIDTLLRFSAMGHQEMKKVRVDLSAIVTDIAADLQLAEPQRQGRFIIPKRVKAFGDPMLLRIVLTNLLGNAWKYTAKRESFVIEFGTATRNGRTVYFVRDNGAGFAMEDVDRLFIPFQRLHKGGEYEGSGIGLATVQRIVRRHGGQVWAEGEVDMGATFWFMLGEG